MIECNNYKYTILEKNDKTIVYDARYEHGMIILMLMAVLSLFSYEGADFYPPVCLMFDNADIKDKRVVVNEKLEVEGTSNFMRCLIKSHKEKWLKSYMLLFKALLLINVIVFGIVIIECIKNSSWLAFPIIVIVLIILFLVFLIIRKRAKMVEDYIEIEI